MELKSYQQKAINSLSAYLNCLNECQGLISAWKKYWGDQDIAVGMGGVPMYKNAIQGVPHVCMKVPTGGGKTFMACASLRKLFDAMPREKARVVVWLVPSDAILAQTIRTLSDVRHPYRQRLDRDFAGRVGVYTKDMLLNGQNFSPDTVREMLTVCVMSYGSLRIDSAKKDVRKVYQENGNLLRFAQYYKDDDILLANTPDTALIQVLRHLSPVTVVDESHNAGSALSEEMLKNLNPSFVLDLTATPRKNSNIIVYVDARELKKEHMVKLPVVVYNRTSHTSVIQDAIHFRASLERQAIAEQAAGGPYVRPIVLFQAQPKISGESETFDKIRNILLEMGIPKDQIAIKTSKIDELGNTDLKSQECPIRYIITVNALKEGWDCPFAYILASLANKTSKVDVEQILGRILRQPYARQYSMPLLNSSYVFTCSNDFHTTLEDIVKGLNQAGFSRKDFRVGENIEVKAPPIPEPELVQMEMPAPEDQDDLFGITAEEIKAAEEQGKNSVTTMEEEALKAAQTYTAEAAGSDNSSFIGGELGEMLNQYKIQPQFQEEIQRLKIPQFVWETVPDLFGGEFELLQEEHLSEGFSLSGQDAQVDFTLATGEMYQIDIQEQGEAVPKYKRVTRAESQYVRDYIAQMPKESKIRNCEDLIVNQLNRNDRYATSDIRDYVHRIIQNMLEDELTAMETAVVTYGKKIEDKIALLEKSYQERQFYKWLDSGAILCKEYYQLPLVITPSLATDSIPCSLYEAEADDMNSFEHEVIDNVAGLDNVHWWHRIIARKGMYLNAFINHYPDFMVMTNSGKLVLIEAKGDHLDGDDSQTKLKLGRTWQHYAGNNYRYFMVYKSKDTGLDGAYTLDEFIEIMRKL